MDELKHEIANATALRTFDPNKQTIIYTDASQQGLGAVLVQVHGQQEQIVGYASRALSGPESRYSTIEKETLACWWGVNHFRHYVWGAEFKLRTDHRPLVNILTTKGSASATPRIANWYARLLPYQYTIEHIPGKSNHPADTMSRLVPPHGPTTEADERWDGCIIINAVEESTDRAFTQTDWSQAAAQDPALQQATEYVTQGWPRTQSELRQNTEGYWAVREQLTIEGSTLKRGDRLAAPTALRSKIMDIAHAGHNGIQALKRMIRDTYWWPAMDRDIEEKVRWCIPCSAADKTKSTHRSPLQPVRIPDKAWDTIGIDIIGPMQLQQDTPVYAIVIMDYMSRWPEVKFLHKVDTSAVINCLKDLFAREGIPRKIVSDNGVQFVSTPMTEFLKTHDIAHTTAALYHPQANGLTERFNRTLKDNIQLNVAAGLDWQAGARNLIWSYRNTPSTLTGHTPFHLMRGRIAASKLVPNWAAKQKPDHISLQDIQARAAAAQEQQKKQYDTTHKTQQHTWQPGDWVVIRKPGIQPKGSSKFSEPIQIKEAGTKTVVTSDHRVWSVDRLAKHQTHTQTDTDTHNPTTPNKEDTQTQGVGREPKESPEEPDSTPQAPHQTAQEENTTTTESSRTTRLRKPPAWLQDYEQ